MKKNVLLYILLAFLIVVNGFFLYNYMGIGNKEKQNGPQKPGDFIVKELGFNKSQLEQFRTLNKTHHQKMRHLSDDVRKLKEGLFDELSETTINNKLIDSITSLIGEKEKEKEAEIFYHFYSIQKICNAKQKEKFNNIIIDALHKGRGEEQRPPHERGGEHRPPPPPIH